jgi:P pilus assembly chaperone PapD
MRTSVWVLAVSLALTPVPLVTTDAWAACSDNKDRTIRVINRSNQRITKMFATNTGNTVWGDDILDQYIAPGSSYEVDADDGSCRCRMDLRARGANGGTWEKRNYDVCSQEVWRLLP